MLYGISLIYFARKEKAALSCASQSQRKLKLIDWCKHVVCLIEVTLEKLVAFIPDLLGRLHIECLFHGNLTKEVSATYFSIQYNRLKSS